MIRRIGVITHSYRHINRYREIIVILVKYGFGDLITRTHLEKYVDLGKKVLRRKGGKEIASLSRWERIRMALEELGPTFVKAGQIMSSRPDILSHELIVELEKLQDSVPPFSGEEAERLVEQELGKPISDLFYEFTDTPIASASIAQVHEAVLEGGEKVVVKVQRPRIEQIIEVDLEIMLHLATLMEKHLQGMDILNPAGIVNEFERSIRKEIDFTIEATHIERFGSNFRRVQTIHVPKVYRNYTTRKILTMEFIDGIKVSNIDALLKSGNDPKIIASWGTDLVLKQVFEHGFFHADPHAGNIMVLDNNIICFIDFGMMGRPLPKQREYLSSIIVGIVNRDAKRITKTFLQLSNSRRIENIDQLEYQVGELVDQYSYLPLKDINMGQLLNEVIKLFVAYKLKMPPNLYLLVKALVSIEGVGRVLDPDFNMVKHMEPFAKDIIKQRLSVSKLSKDFYAAGMDWEAVLRELPTDTRNIISKIKHGKNFVKVG